jgi:hypothetical protein
VAVLVVAQDHGKCPVTKEELSMDDIVLVKTNKVRLLRSVIQNLEMACFTSM